ncbi:MAG: ferredoxin [Candidatus Gracilibacteria bacterium]|nr:ferredoxin [Candidatus Gracilibacteria bacterium]
MKNLPKIMAALILANLLASCTGSAASIEKQSTSDDTSASSLKTSSSDSDSINASTSTNNKTTIKASDSDTKKLTINDKCIGCGHCIREAAKNFAMGSSHKAEVISQENINSTDVSNAISRCPVNAISIA